MKKPSPYLTFAGTIPFIACAILITLGVDSILALGSTRYILATYGLVIATFMAGAQWGNHLALADDNPWASRLPILSNIITLILWFGFLLLSTAAFIGLLMVGFISLLLIDYSLNKASIITAKYFSVRKYVTLIVVISLLISVVQL
ncbi:DUF3429 domain-containing protein [Psychrobacter sp. AH5]|uniref:DUF3429 domain-containing protein n=1 Tax=Psychrobacter sp. AH5 TaxID=2937433 RepID=UPI00333FF1BF